MIDLKKVALDNEIDYSVVCEVGIFIASESHIKNLIPTAEKVLMFEAKKQYADDAKRVFGMYDYVKIYNVAIFNENRDKLKLYDRNASSFIEGLQAPNVVNSGYKPNEAHAFYVEARTFDTYDDGDIDILTCDIEGAEWFMLEKMISRPKILCLETHHKKLGYRNPYMNNISKWLNNNGYVKYCDDITDTVYLKK